MKILNKDKLIEKTGKRLEKLNVEMAKSHTEKCKCCGAKFSFNGYEIQYDEIDYEFDYSSPYYVECPFCHTRIGLSIKFGKLYGNKYEINNCESILNK